MVEERQWSLNEGNVRILRDIDELKVSVQLKFIFLVGDPSKSVIHISNSRT